MKRKPVVRKVLFFSLIFLAIASSYAFVKYVESETSFLTAEEFNREWRQAVPPVDKLRNGDLIFRHSRGTISNMLLHFSLRDSRYSHAGIISIEESGIFVYHALGGEASRNSVLRREPLKDFCQPAYVHSFGIYRLDLNQEQNRHAIVLSKRIFHQKIPFDTGYDLKTDSALYCTEFVYKVLTQASGDKNYLTLTSVPGLTYVACDDLYKNRHAALIYSYTYAD